MKKENLSISEYVLRIRVIADSLLAIGDHISKRDPIGAILQILPRIQSIHHDDLW